MTKPKILKMTPARLAFLIESQCWFRPMVKGFAVSMTLFAEDRRDAVILQKLTPTNYSKWFRVEDGTRRRTKDIGRMRNILRYDKFGTRYAIGWTGRWVAKLMAMAYDHLCPSHQELTRAVVAMKEIGDKMNGMFHARDRHQVTNVWRKFANLRRQRVKLMKEAYDAIGRSRKECPIGGPYASRAVTETKEISNAD